MPDQASARVFRFPSTVDPDAARNAEWDRLIVLTEEVWCWRDPESVATLAHCIDGLARALGREWS